MQMEHCSPVAYLRSLQTADDVEGCVRMLVHLKKRQQGRIHIRAHATVYGQPPAILLLTEMLFCYKCGYHS